MKRLKSISRLKKLNGHDIKSRDSAIVYINGEIFEAHSHAEAVREYQQRNDTDSVYRYDVYKNTNKDEQLAFAHKDDKTNSIFLETDTLKNVDINEVINAIKVKYPNYKIYEDNDEYFTSDNPNDYISLEDKNNINNLNIKPEEYNKIWDTPNFNYIDNNIQNYNFDDDDSINLEIEEY